MNKKQKEKETPPLQTVAEALEKARGQTKAPAPPAGAAPTPATTSQLVLPTSELLPVSARPLPNNKLTFKMDGRDFTLGTGLYLVTGAAGVGKSVLSLGIAASAKLASACEIGNLYFFEVGAPPYAERDEIAMFSDPRRFLDIRSGGDLGYHLASFLRTRTSTNKPAIVVLDSIGEALRAYLSEERKGMTASEGGQQPADRMFVDRLDSYGVSKAIIWLGVINSELVPFAYKLYGATQGIIDVTTYNTFTKRDRVTSRDPRAYRISNDAVQLALQTMRYEARATNGNEDITY